MNQCCGQASIAESMIVPAKTRDPINTDGTACPGVRKRLEKHLKAEGRVWKVQTRLDKRSVDHSLKGSLTIERNVFASLGRDRVMEPPPSRKTRSIRVEGCAEGSVDDVVMS